MVIIPVVFVKYSDIFMLSFWMATAHLYLLGSRDDTCVVADQAGASGTITA